MRSPWGTKLLCLAVMVASLGGGRVLADAACAEFEIVNYVTWAMYYSDLCDGEPSTCTIVDYVTNEVSPPYSWDELPRVCNSSAPPYQCEYVSGPWGSLRGPRTENIAQTAASTGVQQVVYYWCGKRCYCCTVCAATTPAAPAPTVARSKRDPSVSPHVVSKIRLKEKMDEAFTPKKNPKSPWSENINLSFPTYFSFASQRRPGTTIYAKAHVITTQKFQVGTKTYPARTFTSGFEVKKGTETYPLIAAENVKPIGLASYVVKVSGVDYFVHTTE